MALYRTPALAQVLPQLLGASDNADASVVSRSGYYVFPPYFVLERGITLAQWAREERSFFDITSMLERVLGQLHTLHTDGLVHRDLKPGAEPERRFDCEHKA